jgi:hypothetical protein
MRKNSAASTPTDLQLDLLLAMFDGPCSSGDLVETVSALRQRDVPLATFYRQLQRTVDLGWTEIVESGTVDGAQGPGRPERHYRITGVGERFLRDGMEEHQRRIARALANGLLERMA